MRCKKCSPPAKLQEYLDQQVIQIAPLAFMRGRTLNDAVVILDEAQNTTSAQIKMFLTRMGWNTKMIITGDRTQIDLPPTQRSGLVEAERILHNVPGIAFIEMTKKEHRSSQTRQPHCRSLRCLCPKEGDIVRKSRQPTRKRR